jgi:damage-control phosphatase, subfamily I
LKMASNCYSCIMDRAKFECDLSMNTEEEKLLAMEELLDFMASNKGGVPALVGTEREMIIKRRSGNPDPYASLKAQSNRTATELIPIASEFYQMSENKLEAIIRIAAAANSMEFGVKGHDFSPETFGRRFEDTLHETLDGDLKEVERRLGAYDNILYLTDNAGEVIFDLFVVDKLEEMGKRVVMASKSEPVLNDVTASELRHFTSREVIETGPVVGTILDSLSPEAKELLQSDEWLIFSKGMGNFETLYEIDERFKGRLIYVLRAKCEPVASKLRVLQGSLVVRAI